MKAKPKILITNDDGIFSSGIYALWEALSQVGDVYVVAPSDEKSAASHSITINNLLRVKKVKKKTFSPPQAINSYTAVVARSQQRA